MIKNPNPSHPGKILAGLHLEDLGWSQTRLAQEIGCSHAKVNEVINGRRGISPEFALDLERVLGISAETWLRLQADYDLHVARKKARSKKPAKKRKVA